MGINWNVKIEKRNSQFTLPKENNHAQEIRQDGRLDLVSKKENWKANSMCWQNETWKPHSELGDRKAEFTIWNFEMQNTTQK